MKNDKLRVDGLEEGLGKGWIGETKKTRSQKKESNQGNKVVNSSYGKS